VGHTNHRGHLVRVGTGRECWEEAEGGTDKHSSGCHFQTLPDVVLMVRCQDGDCLCHFKMKVLRLRDVPKVTQSQRQWQGGSPWLPVFQAWNGIEVVTSVLAARWPHWSHPQSCGPVVSQHSMGVCSVGVCSMEGGDWMYGNKNDGAGGVVECLPSMRT
jgi:hypothetical protein